MIQILCYVTSYLTIYLFCEFYYSAIPMTGSDEEDKEYLKQECMAKRFAKRTRMNRLLEAHNDENNFSQSRLIDDDYDLKKELKSIRVSNCLFLAPSTKATTYYSIDG